MIPDRDTWQAAKTHDGSGTQFPSGQKSETI